MIRILLVTAALIVPISTTYAQDVQAPSGGGTLPLDDLEANDGTLPLKLPGDGTLPLRLSGDAVNQSAGSKVPTNVVLTEAERRALPAAQRPSLVCQLDGEKVSKHKASGTVEISGTVYQVKGICYDHSNKNMEIVGAKGSSEKSFMIGRLPGPEPTSFTGSLIVNGNGTTRYQFVVRSQSE